MTWKERMKHITFPSRIAVSSLSQPGRPPGDLCSRFSKSTRNALGNRLASNPVTIARVDLKLIER